MFGNYKFGDISKSIYNTVSGADNTNDDTSASKEETKSNKDSTESQQKEYQFGDITKSLYNKWSDPKYQYKFGDVSKTLYRSITAQPEPFSVEIKSPIKEGLVQKRCPILLTYTKYWAALEGKSLYIFNNNKAYSQCIQVINLLSCDGARAIPNGVKGEFELFSANVRHRFVTKINERTEWIHCLQKIIAAQKLHETKESLMTENEHQDELAFDLQCIAYYIIDLEYTHSESGDPQILLRNQNFMIAMLIWSYVHDEDKPFYLELVKDLDDDQQQALKYWQQPIAVAHGIHGGLETMKKSVPSYAMYGGIASGFMAHAVTGRHVKGQAAHPLYNSSSFVILPLAVIGGLACGAASVPYCFASGFQDSYNAVKR